MYMYTDKVKHYNLPPAVLMDLFVMNQSFSMQGFLNDVRCVINAIVILLLTFILYIQHVIKFNPLPKRWLHVVNSKYNSSKQFFCRVVMTNQIFFDEILSGRNSRIPEIYFNSTNASIIMYMYLVTLMRTPCFLIIEQTQKNRRCVHSSGTFDEYCVPLPFHQELPRSHGNLTKSRGA